MCGEILLRRRPGSERGRCSVVASDMSQGLRLDGRSAAALNRRDSGPIRCGNDIDCSKLRSYRARKSSGGAPRTERTSPRVHPRGRCCVTVVEIFADHNTNPRFRFTFVALYFLETGLHFQLGRSRRFDREDVRHRFDASRAVHRPLNGACFARDRMPWMGHVHEGRNMFQNLEFVFGDYRLRRSTLPPKRACRR